MKILIIGSGGREHAFAWKVSQSDIVTHVYVAPGNAGTALETKTSNVAIAAEDISGLLHFAKRQQIDLTIVGPEAPLAAGIVDQFTAVGLSCFGPSKAAAQLESSKIFCKQFLLQHDIPTARAEYFTDPKLAKAYVAREELPIVIKADGLAAGKGVVIATTLAEAEQTIDAMLTDERFGSAGKRILIEEFLQGEELSFIVLTDGDTILPLASSQDHKAIGEGDIGSNTGGMGAYSPSPLATPKLESKILQTIIQPTIQGLAKQGIRYSGFLYAGLMITTNGDAKVLEYNCRFGDPETQPILMRLKSDFTRLCFAAAQRHLDQQKLEWDPRVALCVVMAAKGYPNTYTKNQVIRGLDQVPEAPDLKIFHSGTQQQGGVIVTQGGRVLSVTALGETVAAAQQHAYAAVAKISWDECYYRRDIGYRATGG